MSYELNPEEKEILEAFENGELTPVPDAQEQMELARQAARNTLGIIEGQKVASGYGAPSMRGAGSA